MLPREKKKRCSVDSLAAAANRAIKSEIKQKKTQLMLAENITAATAKGKSIKTMLPSGNRSCQTATANGEHNKRRGMNKNNKKKQRKQHRPIGRKEPQKNCSLKRKIIGAEV